MLKWDEGLKGLKAVKLVDIQYSEVNYIIMLVDSRRPPIVALLLGRRCKRRIDIKPAQGEHLVVSSMVKVPDTFPRDETFAVKLAFHIRY